MIFIVEDEPPLLRSFIAFFEAGGFDVEGYGSAEEALEAARKSPPDAVICDLQLPGMSGLELIEQLAELDPGLVRILMTAHSSVSSALRAMKSGCYEYLEKPVDLQQLERLINRALSERRSGLELAWLRKSKEEESTSHILGESDAIAEVRKQIETLGRLGTNLPHILITGETGVGKGLVARAIHDAAMGAERPWIDVSCAAIPETLIEAELFGFEKSAFTDAKQAKPGLFEAAAGGTVFLDEIGELPITVQSKLLLVSESGKVRRLGTVRDRSISTAIIAATNVDLKQAIKDGRFRGDLYHRLAAFTLEVPPLRERGDDAVILARELVGRAAKRYRKAVRGLSPQAESRLASWAWPGNVRELQFTIDRAVLLCSEASTVLTEREIEAAGVGAPSTPAASTVGAPDGATRIAVGADGVQVDLPEGGVSYAELEKAILSAALRRTNYNVVQAARLLDLKRDAMRYRIQKLGLELNNPNEDG